MEALIQLTEKAFQYYNGKINPNIPAILELTTMRDVNDKRCAYTRYPNIVRVQPLNVYEWCKRHHSAQVDYKDRTRYMIIESVIHELYHVEQFLMYSYVNDIEYVRRIEADVDFMTACYVLGHLQELYQVFGVVVDSEMIEYLKLFRPYKNRLYERKNIFEHICLFVDETAGKDKDRNKAKNVISEIIRYVEEVPNSIIKFIVDGKEIIIKSGEYEINVNRFNQEIYEYYYKHTCFKHVNIVVSWSETEYHYIVTTEGGSNIMAKKIQKYGE